MAINFWRRSPHGERGLKLDDRVHLHDVRWSLPSRGAWIEIQHKCEIRTAQLVAPLTGSVD